MYIWAALTGAYSSLRMGILQRTNLQEVTDSDELILMYRYYYHMSLDRYVHISSSQRSLSLRACPFAFIQTLSQSGAALQTS